MTTPTYYIQATMPVYYIPLAKYPQKLINKGTILFRPAGGFKILIIHHWHQRNDNTYKCLKSHRERLFNQNGITYIINTMFPVRLEIYYTCENVTRIIEQIILFKANPDLAKLSPILENMSNDWKKFKKLGYEFNVIDLSHQSYNCCPSEVCSKLKLFLTLNTPESSLASLENECYNVIYNEFFRNKSCLECVKKKIPALIYSNFKQTLFKFEDYDCILNYTQLYNG